MEVVVPIQPLRGDTSALLHLQLHKSSRYSSKYYQNLISGLHAVLAKEKCNTTTKKYNWFNCSICDCTTNTYLTNTVVLHIPRLKWRFGKNAVNIGKSIRFTQQSTAKPKEIYQNFLVHCFVKFVYNTYFHMKLIAIWDIFINYVVRYLVYLYQHTI